jgi:hypothetical protein
MSYTVAPDITTSSLAIENGSTSNAGLNLSQLGGGFTWSRSTPLYLEGNAALSRYDPEFTAEVGGEQRAVAAHWESMAATGGIGWDFPLSPHWVIRPILNFTLGYVESELTTLKWWLDQNASGDLAFLDGGRLDVYGVGGSLMLDYARFSPAADDDLELRYTNVALRSYGASALGVQGHAQASNASLWARRRVPTGWGSVWDRPLRYVYEAAFTRFFGDENNVGLTFLAALGLGLELDSSARDYYVSRARALVRYKVGPDVQGWTVGLAVSF